MSDATKIFAPCRFVPFEPGHAEGVIAVIESCYAEYGEQIELETLDNDLHHIAEKYVGPGSTFRVLLDGDHVIGSTAVKRVGERECELKRVFLDRHYRGRGWGRAMSLWAINWAVAQGYRTMHIWSDVLYEGAHGLYRKLGARDTGERRFIGGVNECWERYFVLALEAS